MWNLFFLPKYFNLKKLKAFFFNSFIISRNYLNTGHKHTYLSWILEHLFLDSQSQKTKTSYMALKESIYDRLQHGVRTPYTLSMRQVMNASGGGLQQRGEAYR